MLGRADLCLKFSAISKDNSDIPSFSHNQWLLTILCSAGNMCILETSISIYVHVSEYISHGTIIVNPQLGLFDLLEKDRID